MQNLAPLIAAALLLGACDTGQAPGEPVAAGSGSATPASSIRPLAGKWRLQSGGGGKALVLIAADGKPTLRLYCPAGGGRIEVGVPAFRSIASEERLSFGSGGAVAALVADPRRNTRGGGVSAAGAVPGELSALIAGPLSASYGAQTSGPHPAPPAALASGFMAACGKAMVTAAPSAAVSPCLLQGTERLTVASLRAIGTEPFWGARIEGRCVTYSTPEDQHGTRVWTRYTPLADGGMWSGAFGGSKFELTARTAPGCSDGMSDRRYPVAVTLQVGGERRTGCAEPQ